jgi:hypothetical protein
MPTEVWGTGLRQTFRLLPMPSASLPIFLSADGSMWQQVLGRLPYDASRSRTAGKTTPDAKRYRDPKQVYENAGLIFQDKDGIVHVTELGKATLRWIPMINRKNVVILGRHAAFALAAAQLRNPTLAGGKYDARFEVFPFVFIWRAMIALGGRISSDEMNRAILRVKNEADLALAIEAIKKGRGTKNLDDIGKEVVTEAAKDDRIIPWMSLASFGWVLFSDKHAGVYEIYPETLDIVRQAAAVLHKHRDFTNNEEYVRHLDRAAALPKDLR